MQLIAEIYPVLKDQEAKEKYVCEYRKFKTYSETYVIIVNDENVFRYDGQNIQDDILFKLMENAKRQVVNLAEQKNKNFKEIATAKPKAAKKSGKHFIAQIVISIIVIIAIIIFSIIGLCS